MVILAFPTGGSINPGEASPRNPLHRCLLHHGVPQHPVAAAREQPHKTTRASGPGRPPGPHSHAEPWCKGRPTWGKRPGAASAGGIQLPGQRGCGCARPIEKSPLSAVQRPWDHPLGGHRAPIILDSDSESNQRPVPLPSPCPAAGYETPPCPAHDQDYVAMGGGTSSIAQQPSEEVPIPAGEVGVGQEVRAPLKRTP